MQLGVFNLMQQRERDKTPRQIYTESIEQVQLAEALGFDVAWFAEHHFSNYCVVPSPVTMCTYMAAKTKRIKIGPAVIVAPLYEPVRLLEDLAVCDLLSDGRLVLGLGSGYQEYEFHKFNVDLTTGRDRFLEIMDLVEKFWAKSPLTYKGKYYNIPETHFSVRPIQKNPDVFVAGLFNDPVTQERIARNGYVPITTTGWMSVEEIAQIRDKSAAVYAKVVGNPDNMPFAVQQYIHVTDSKDEALVAADNCRYVRRIAAAMREKYGKLRDGAFLEEIPAKGEPPLEEIAQRCLIGSSNKIAEQLIAEIEGLKLSHLSCFFAFGSLEHKKVMKTMERFGAEVLPQIKKHFGSLEKAGVPVQRRLAAAAE
jgi:alkanesulfonate monooxygenase SsuD/methylene tetrahydromethanopterin reductase-like flavin-dependent oxidoreductase (luciferase family)